MYPIVLNQSNVSNTLNNKYTYRFSQSLQLTNKHEIALANISMFKSWFNVSSSFNNNYFQYRWIDNSIHTVLLPDGNYELEAINQYLQTEFVKNKHYMYDPITKKNVYYIDFQVNETYYRYDAYFYTVPIISENTLTKPEGSTWVLLDVKKTPSLIIPDTNFKYLIGFEAHNDYGYSNKDNVVSSTMSPQISPIQSIFFNCNLINNRLSNNPNLIHVMNHSGYKFGNLIQDRPNELMWIPCSQGSYNHLDLTLIDNKSRMIDIKDNDVVFVILIREKP